MCLDEREQGTEVLFILLFNKELYGLKSSGKRQAERLHDIIKDMGFTPSKADPCV